MKCVLRDWVIEQPLAIQGTLITAIRGPDGTPKITPAKQLVQAYRYTVLNNAHDREFAGSFMGDWTGHPRSEVVEAFMASPDEYPHHWLMHFTHATEIVGYLHPDSKTRYHWKDFYYRVCSGLHMNPETKTQMLSRLESKRK